MQDVAIEPTKIQASSMDPVSRESAPCGAPASSTVSQAEGLRSALSRLRMPRRLRPHHFNTALV